MTMTMSTFFGQASSWLTYAIKGMSRWQGVDWDATYEEEDEQSWEDDKRKPASSLAGAEVLGSQLDPDSNLHIVMLDIDLNAVLLPSSTEGHFHLIFDHTVEWDEYKEFLDACVKIGIVGEGYRHMALKRGETMLRPPWIQKGREKEDAASAMASVLLGTDVDSQKVAAREEFKSAWGDDLPF